MDPAKLPADKNAPVVVFDSLTDCLTFRPTVLDALPEAWAKAYPRAARLLFQNSDVQVQRGRCVGAVTNSRLKGHPHYVRIAAILQTCETIETEALCGIADTADKSAMAG